MKANRETILSLLQAWIDQRPGLEYGNYGSPTSYRAEQRSIARDKRHAQRLLSAVAMQSSISADDLRTAFRDAYSGRLSLIEDERGARLQYCTGQYWPTEYRRAACAVLASALWESARAHLPPTTQDAHGNTYLVGTRQRIGHWLRKEFRRIFGVQIQRRWFD